MAFALHIFWLIWLQIACSIGNLNKSNGGGIFLDTVPVMKHVVFFVSFIDTWRYPIFALKQSIVCCHVNANEIGTLSLLMMKSSWCICYECFGCTLAIILPVSHDCTSYDQDTLTSITCCSSTSNFSAGSKILTFWIPESALPWMLLRVQIQKWNHQ